MTSMRRRAVLTLVAFAATVLTAGSATAAGLLTGAQVKDGSIAGRDVRDASVGGRDVRDRSLARADIDSSVHGPPGVHAGGHAARQERGLPGLAGPAGATGPAGPAGPAGAVGPVGPAGIHDPVYVVSPPKAIAAQYVNRWYVDCPYSHEAVGGGFEAFSGFWTGNPLQSGPDPVEDSWWVAIRNTGDSEITARAWAVCIPTS